MSFHARARVLAIGVFLLSATGFVTALAEDSAPDLVGLVDGCRFPTLEGPGVPVADRTISVGSIELTLSEGIVYPLRRSDGVDVGVFFRGKGAYDYVSQDPVDRQVIARNLSKASALELREGFTIHDTFSEALLFGSAPWPRDWLGEPGPTAADVDAGSAPEEEAIRRADKLGRRILDRPAQRLAEIELNAWPEHTYAYAELAGGREGASFEFDNVVDFVERLYVTKKEDDFWWRRLVSQQQLHESHERPAPALWLRDAAFDIATEDNRSGRISSKLTLEVGRDRTRYGLFGLISHRDPRGRWVVEGKNALTVQAITDGAGSSLNFAHRRHELLVDLGRDHAIGERIVLDVETTGEVFTGMTGERHDNYVELFSVDWHPVPAGPEPAAFTFSLKIRTRKPYRPIASGKQLSFEEDGDFFVLESERDAPSTHLAVFAGKYKTYEEVFDGLPIRVHSYAMSGGKRAETLARLAHAFIRFYEELLGPYPFAELDIVEVPEYGFGIAPSGMILLTTEAYKPLAAFSAFFVRGINSRLAHEVAHHWFGHKAMVNHSREWWLSESFAEYTSALAMRVIQPKGSTRIVGAEDMLIDWRNMNKECKDMGSVLAANQLAGDEAPLHRFCLLYNRGPLLLHMLRSMVGEEQFTAMLRTFLDRADMQPVTTADFRRAVAEVRGFDMGWYFEQWIAEPGIADVGYEYRVDPAENGGYVLSGKLEQQPEHFKKLVVPILLEMRGGQQGIRVVVQDEPLTSFLFDLAQEPRRVTIDPNKNNLARYDRR
jgi:hypothetical protein